MKWLFEPLMSLTTQPQAEIRARLVSAARIFICYSHTDRRFARRFYRHLIALRSGSPKESVFLDEFSLRPGDPVSPDVVDAALVSSDLMVVLGGRDTAKSVEVNREIALAKSKSIPILPVILTLKTELPRDIDYKIQGVSVDSIFRFRIVERVIAFTFITLFVAASSGFTIQSLEASRARLDAADQHRRDRWAAMAAREFANGNARDALVLAFAALPTSEGREVPPATPLHLLHSALAEALAPTISDPALFPPAVQQYDRMDPTRTPRDNTYTGQPQCSFNLCQFEELTFSDDGRYIVQSDNGNAIFVMDTKKVEQNLTRTNASQQQFVVGDQPERSVTVRVAGAGNVRYTRKLEEPGVTSLQSECSRYPDLDVPRPCAVTSVAIMEGNRIVVGLQGGTVLGLSKTGELQWATSLQQCEPFRETAKLSNCGIRSMIVDGDVVVAGIDNGSVVVIRQDGRLIEPIGKESPLENFTLGTGTPIGAFRSDWCSDEYAYLEPYTSSENDCMADDVWKQDGIIHVLRRNGNVSRWRRNDDAIENLDGDYSYGESALGEAQHSEWFAAFADRIVVSRRRRFSNGNWGVHWTLNDAGGLAIYDGATRSLIADYPVRNPADVVDYRGKILWINDPSQRRAIELTGAPYAQARALSPRELRDALCDALEIQPGRPAFDISDDVLAREILC